jgi:hypothetical protein
MKTPSAVLVLVLIASTVAGEERSVPPTIPQPRLRLDPISRAAVVVPAKEAGKEPNTSVVVMDKFIVKEQGVAPKEPTDEEGPKGGFSILGGGYVAMGEIGKAQWEIGVFPWLPRSDVMWRDQKFKPQKTRVDWDFLRVHW